MEGAARFVNDDDAEPLPVGVVVLMRGDEEHDIAFFILIAPFLPPLPSAPTRLGATAPPARRKEGDACGIRPVVEAVLPSPPTFMAAPLAGLCPLLLFSDIGESGRGAAVLTVGVTGTPPAGSTTIGGAANAVLLLLPLPAFLT